jgi:hypothetical protein
MKSEPGPDLVNGSVNQSGDQDQKLRFENRPNMPPANTATRRVSPAGVTAQ